MTLIDVIEIEDNSSPELPHFKEMIPPQAEINYGTLVLAQLAPRQGCIPFPLHLVQPKSDIFAGIPHEWSTIENRIILGLLLKGNLP